MRRILLSIAVLICMSAPCLAQDKAACPKDQVRDEETGDCRPIVWPKIASVKIGTPPNQIVHFWITSEQFFDGWQEWAHEKTVNSGRIYRVQLLNDKGERFDVTATVENLSDETRQVFLKDEPEMKDPNTVQLNITPPLDKTGNFVIAGIFDGQKPVVTQQKLSEYAFSIF